jgi:uncharacterized membrane protein HdeD (DUF308 family)
MVEHSMEHSEAESRAWHSLRHNWGWLLALGIVWVAFGTLAIIMPLAAGLAFELILGAIFAAGGVFQIFQAVRCRGSNGALMQGLGGALALILGGLLLVFPLQGLASLTLLLSAFFIVAGGFKIVASLQHRSLRYWGWLLVSGILGVLVGVLIWIGWPSSAAWALGLLAGIELIFGGWSMVMLALAARRA